MDTISVNYAVKFNIDFAPHYKFTETKICINAKTGRVIRQIYKNRSIGYCIDGRFYSISHLRKHLIKPIKQECPF